jgi:hypothetical protein
MNFSLADSFLSQAIPTVTPAAQMVIWQRGKAVHNVSLGFLDSESKTPPTRPD